MSRKANPTLIGAFVLGAAFFATATVIYVGSVNIFSREEVFLLYFNESINGLSVGAPVKFRGVPIGKVSDIKIRFNQSDLSSAIPVFISIDVKNLMKNLGVEVDLSNQEKFEEQIKYGGLRGRLQIQSLITGQLFVELDYIEDPPLRPVLYQQRIVYKEIPTEPSVMAQFGATTSEVVAKLSAIDVRAINDELVSLLTNLNGTIEELDLNTLNRSLVDSSFLLQEKLKELDLLKLQADVDETLAALRVLTSELNRHVAPSYERVAKVSERLQATLQEYELVAKELQGYLSTDSGLRHEVVQFLISMQSASEAITELAEFLQRNPGAFLAGRKVGGSD